jgi:mono/diheme cytochrome c family protein
MTQHRRILHLAAIFTLAASAALAGEKEKLNVDITRLPPASDKKDVTYAADIQRIFEKSCVNCHGPEKAKAKLRLDSLPVVLKGGEDGKVVKPGDSAGSMLIHNVAHIGDPDAYMPPPRNKAGIQALTPEQIGLLRAWIDQGAK